jgi:hypothetical protein
MRKLYVMLIPVVMILSLPPILPASTGTGNNPAEAVITKDYDGPYDYIEYTDRSFTPYLKVDDVTIDPLAGPTEDLTIMLCNGDQDWYLLKEYTNWKDVNRFGVYTDLGVGTGQTLIFSGGHSEGAAITTNFPDDTEVGLWFLNDTNNDSIFNGDDSYLFSERSLTAGATENEYQWFIAYDLSPYKGTGATYEFFCPTENFSFSGDYNYAVFIDDNHTSSNWDHNDMILAMNCPNSPPEAYCPDNSSVFLCELGPVTIPGFSFYDPDDNVATVEATLGTYNAGEVTFTPTGAGDHVIGIIVTDEAGAADTCYTTVTVTLNSPPTCTMPPADTITLCSALEVCVPFTTLDPDDNLAGCEVIMGPGMIVNGNWCYTPSASEFVQVVIECEDECGAVCQGVIEIEFVIKPNWAVIVIDRTGSMALVNTFGEPRLDRARAQAHTEVDKLLDPADTDYPGVFEVAVMSFNSSSGIQLHTDFVHGATTLHDALDAIINPRHDTPLAAAMCQAHCTLPGLLGECVKYVITFTDGLENASQFFEICDICEPCDALVGTGWNYDCDPSNPASCTDWQLCLADVFANSGVNLMHYFGEPINPFTKAGEGLEDLYFLKYTAEASQGTFVYYSDNEHVCADANGDKIVNISDAVFVINYVFAGGDAPEPLLAGDANWDGSINVSDAAYIIGHVFSGLQVPTCAH